MNHLSVTLRNASISTGTIQSVLQTASKALEAAVQQQQSAVLGCQLLVSHAAAAASTAALSVEEIPSAVRSALNSHFSATNYESRNNNNNNNNYIPLVGGVVDGAATIQMTLFYTRLDGNNYNHAVEAIRISRNAHRVRPLAGRGVGRWPGMVASSLSHDSNERDLPHEDGPWASGGGSGGGGHWAENLLGKYAADLNINHRNNGVTNEEQQPGDNGTAVEAAVEADLLLLLTDSDPLPLLQHNSALPARFRNARQVAGIVGSQTPFLCGTPHALFHNDTVHGSGAVGFALYGLQSAAASYTLYNPPITPLTRDDQAHNKQQHHDWQTITQCQGNVIMQLDGQPALQSLLKRLPSNNSRAIEDEYSSQTLLLIDQGANPHLVRRITGGDPAGNGHFAVQLAGMTLRPGMRVGFARMRPYLLDSGHWDNIDSCIRLRKLSSADEPIAAVVDDHTETEVSCSATEAIAVSPQIIMDSSTGILFKRTINNETSGDESKQLQLLQLEEVDGTVVEMKYN